MNKPGRHIMLDNLAAGITAEELRYLLENTPLSVQTAALESLKSKRDLELREKQRNCEHSPGWYMGLQCTRCGGID